MSLYAYSKREQANDHLRLGGFVFDSNIETYKDKDRLRKLLKTYSMDEIERVITFEVEEKFGKSYMSNFSTFLNNFPDPNCIDVAEKADNNADIIIDETRLNFNGQIYR
jgi:hypothetical protein